jgi:AcrR family transcriptional regulator
VALARTPPSRWIEQGLQALADGGPDAVRVEPLARALGVTKGGFYGYFADRGALLDEILRAWERAMIDEAIERVEAGGGDGRERLRRLFGLASSAEARTLLRVDLAVRDWARRDRAVARRLRRVDDRRMDYMRGLFRELCADEDEVEARCLIAFSLFVGSGFIAAGHGDRTRSEVLELALARLLA